jgi:3'(2'), 5'-bisphosphate nucleotidase
MSKLLQNPGALCNMVRRTAMQAGEIILKYYDEMELAGVQEKSDGSPVSLADQEAEKFINQELAKLVPGIPVIGEESAEAGTLPSLENAEYFWLVDPLDGTKEFITGGDDFTVNIALIHNGDPVLGVVYAPARGALYAGHGPGTAIRWLEENNNEKSIRVRKPPRHGLTVVASARHGDAIRMDKFLEDFKIEKLIRRGSSLKICSIAEGKADMYPRFGPTCEWDTAAADAVLRAADGFMTDTTGKALRYGGAGTKFLNPEFIAASFDWFNAQNEEAV